MNISDNMGAGSAALQTGVTGVAAVFIGTTLRDMTPYLIVAATLILIDLYFGVRASVARGERIRPSRAIRRTLGKTFEYVCWVCLSSSLSVAFEAKAIEWIILGLVMGNEVVSVASNYFEAHGKTLKGLNIWKIIGSKANIDLSGVTVEDIKKEDNGNDNEKL